MQNDLPPALLTDTSYYKIALENVPMHVIMTDPQGTILYANDAVEKITGYSKEEVLGKTPALWGKQMPPTYYQTLWQIIKANKGTYEGELLNRRKNGEVYSAYIKIAPILNTQQAIIGYVGIEQDISETKRIHEELKIFHSIMQESSDFIILIDFEEKTIIDANNTALNVLGLHRTDLGNIKLLDLNIHLQHDNQEMTMTDIMKTLPQDRRYLLEGTISNANDAIPFEFNINFVEYDDKSRAVLSAETPPIDSEKYVLCTGRDIRQRKEFERRMKDFTSIVSHQLRTPLGGERWLLEMLLNNEYGELPDAVRDHLKTMYTNKLDMIALVKSLLDVSHLEKGNAINNPEHIAVEAAIRSVINKLEPIIAEKSITLSMIPEHFNQTIYVDPTLFQEVVTNLISNAVRYSYQNGSVTIKLAANNDNVSIAIQDTGIGIRPEDIPKLFKRFYRADNAKRISPEGSGIGLFFVKLCVDEWGGTINVESEEEKGSTFTITIPVNPNNHQPAE